VTEDFPNIHKAVGSNSAPQKINNKNFLAGCQWLTPIILVTQETEIRKIAVQSQVGK
jgi:hypothetical protein